jgi:hypothetical protein
MGRGQAASRFFTRDFQAYEHKWASALCLQVENRKTRAGVGLGGRVVR